MIEPSYPFLLYELLAHVGEQKIYTEFSRGDVLNGDLCPVVLYQDMRPLSAFCHHSQAIVTIGKRRGLIVACWLAWPAGNAVA